MKVAIYCENGATQLVLTPEGEFEKNAVKTLEGKTHRLEVHSGSFAECKGGYFRRYEEEFSVMLLTRPLPPAQAAEPITPDHNHGEHLV